MTAKEFAKTHNLKEDGAVRCVVGYPTEDPESGFGTDSDFYLKLERLGNKHFVRLNNEEKLAQWLKLADEIFELG